MSLLPVILTAKKSSELLSKFQDEKPFVKNRNGLFTQKDLRSSEQLRRWDIKIFLDLKLHDIQIQSKNPWQ